MIRILNFSLLIIWGYSLSGQPAGLTNYIDSLVGINVTNDSPGCTIGIIREGKLVFKKLYGLANLDYRIPVTDSTVFNLASVSKQFTAHLVLLLEKEGRLNLDDEIQRFIPELSNYAHPTRSLLCIPRKEMSFF